MKTKGGLDKRIERARARHELTRPVMGTIFLVTCIVCMQYKAPDGNLGLHMLYMCDKSMINLTFNRIY